VILSKHFIAEPIKIKHNKLTKHLKNMSRITKLLKERPHGILSVYFTAGHPDPSQIKPIIHQLTMRGIDMIEIGIPFSDPMADGPVIQRSSAQALSRGMTLPLLFEHLTGIRRNVTIPLLLMGYLNPIMQYGFEPFCKSCHRVGIDGLIIPDLPFAEYIAEYKSIADAHDLKVIMLITPETSEERIRLIDAETDGFIYMVSSASTTGAQENFPVQTKDYFCRIASMNLKNPCLIGFGISNKSTYDCALEHATGVIVGSKFVSLLDESPTPGNAVSSLLYALRGE
jgi:tryptophan synthase alpha chain